MNNENLIKGITTSNFTRNYMINIMKCFYENDRVLSEKEIKELSLVTKGQVRNCCIMLYQLGCIQLESNNGNTNYWKIDDIEKLAPLIFYSSANDVKGYFGQLKN